MSESELDKLKSSRRLQAYNMAQKLRLQPINTVAKSVATQNEWEKIILSKRVDMIRKDSNFQQHKLENERRHFVTEQRRLLKPAFDTGTHQSKQATSLGMHAADEQHVIVPRIEPINDQEVRGDDVTPFDSEFLRIVEFYESNKPNVIKRLHAEEQKNEGDVTAGGQTKKIKVKGKVRHKLGAERQKSKVGSLSQSTGNLLHVKTEDAVLSTQQDDGERNTSLGFYLATGSKLTDLNTSLNASADTRSTHLPKITPRDLSDLDEHHDADWLKESFQTGPKYSEDGAIIPLNFMPPNDENQHVLARPPPIPEVRYQSPPSTKKFRNYKLRTPATDRPRPSAMTPSTDAPVKMAAMTPRSDDVMQRGAAGRRLMLSGFEEGEDEFRAALTEANLKLHLMNMKEQRRRTTPRRPDTRTSMATPAGLGAVTTHAPNTLDDVSTIRTGKPRVIASMPNPFFVEKEN